MLAARHHPTERSEDKKREVRIVRWFLRWTVVLIGAGLLVFLGMEIGSSIDLKHVIRAYERKYELDCYRVAEEEESFNRMIQFCRDRRRLNERYVYDCGRVIRDMKKFREKIQVCKFTNKRERQPCETFMIDQGRIIIDRSEC